MIILNLKNRGLFLITNLALLLTVASAPLCATDNLPQERFQRELAQAETLAKTLKPDETLWLDVDQEKFLAIFTPDLSGQPKGGAIILHDADGHPDWPDVVRPLRTFLPLHGWATIAIQLPHLDSIDGYLPHQQLINHRIQKAAEHLRSIGLNNIALIGHGSGAMAAATYLANDSSDQGIRGFVGISLSVVMTEKSDDYLPAQLEKIKLPILDIYGSRDLATVTTTARERSLAAKKSSNNATTEEKLEPYKKAGLSKSANNSIRGYIAYRQLEIEGANHNFNSQDGTLSKRVLGWLERHTNGTAITSSR